MNASGINISDITKSILKAREESGYLKLEKNITYLYNKGQFQDNWEYYNNNGADGGHVFVEQSYESDHLFARIHDSADDTAYALWATKEKVDLTNFSKIYFEFDTNVSTMRYMDLAAGNKKEYGFYYNPSEYVAGKSLYVSDYDFDNRNIYDIDVTGVNGEYYILFQPSSAYPISEIRLYRVWAE